MSSASAAVQAILDSLGISISKATLITSITDDAERYIQNFLSSVLLISSNSRSQCITSQHINRTLKATRQPCLFGYSESNIPIVSVFFDQSELIVPKENTVLTKKLTEMEREPLPTQNSYQFDYLLTEGVPTHKKLLSNRRILVKIPKLIERSASVTPLQPSSAPSNIDLTRKHSVSITDRVYDHNQSAGDVITGELQLFYVRIINLMHEDLLNSKESALNCLVNESGFQQLLPYFLQFIYGQMILNYQDVQLMTILIQMTRALAANKYLTSDHYVHCFLKIAFSGLLGFGFTTKEYKEDFLLRENAAELISILSDKYERSYPSIKLSIFNSLIKALFDPATTLNAHYGALCGIEALGVKAIEHIKPHLKSYEKFIVFANKNKTIKATEMIVNKIKSMLNDR
ncbi:transcription initiation factor TFIID, subunit TAF6 [Histomonas meleagridis]|uniref:transcription initiation factor TFIID, subunit TAF6 n=1 Tax=Histomonas meleagridis TaxID=135588 RepID=UPI003559484E|nr:transcription initiation factor TFIID, subunit TAF6 [Histomonas meleagridis]KAH0806514.1 transcription initiation factor TFIID, subunit TAF6 [Histomonas meleagridis]